MHGKRRPSKCGTAPQWAASRSSCPSSSKIVTSSASQKRAALLTTASSTGWSSVGEALMILRTSAVAVRCSSASCSSRVSRATSVSGLAAEEPLWRGVFGVLRRFSVTVLRRLVLAASPPPALERRLIASPEAQDKASCRFKLAHWKRPGAVLCVTANFDRECPLWVKSRRRPVSA